MAEQFALIFLCLYLVAGGRALDNGLGLTPAMGWNTWCTLGKCGRDYCDEKEIMSIADAMVANGMQEYGYQYINLDDCWADHRDSSGTIVPDKDRFPGGLVPVIQYVNNKQFKFGVYTDAGLYTCSKGERDHKIPGSYGHYEQDANTYAQWGVEYVKMDWCNTKVNGSKLDPKNQYPQMSKALNSTKRPIFFNSCEWGVEDPWEWMVQYANSWRSGPDHHDDWKTTAEIIETNADKGKYAMPGGWNDADFLMTGGQGCHDNAPLIHCPGMTDIEYRTEFTMWCIMGSSLIVATDIRNMTDIMTTILFNKELIDVNQDKNGSGGNRIGNWDCSEGAKYCQIWAKKMNDGRYAVAIYNAGEESHNISFSFDLLDKTWESVTLRDLWEHKDMGTFTSSYMAMVEPHGVQAYMVAQTSS